MDYCRRSANPGRAPAAAPVRATGETRLRAERKRLRAAGRHVSDAICSALQFINFWQDVAVDWKKGRVYIPQEDLARFGVREDDIAGRSADERWARAHGLRVRSRARACCVSGAPLGRALPGRIGPRDPRDRRRAAIAILDKIDAVRGDVFRHRPALGQGGLDRASWRAPCCEAPR